MCPLIGCSVRNKVAGQQCVIPCSIHYCIRHKSMVVWHGAWVSWLLICLAAIWVIMCGQSSALKCTAAHMTGVQEG